ncbi:MAG: tetratricopeptide repeat protein [Candidatus Acidiferrales bacterium]
MIPPPTRAVIAIVIALLCLQGRAQGQQHETDNVVRFFQWKVSQDSDDFFNYDRLGVAYIQKARETGDITYYNLAAKALEKSLNLESSHPEAAPATKHLATVYFAEHRFREALALAQKAADLNPRDVTSFALIGDARSEMGEYEAAWAAYTRLQNPLDAQSAASGVEYLEESRESAESLLIGDAKDAIDHMQQAVAISIESDMAKESIAWSQFTLGENYFQLGDLANAKAAYSDALQTYPGYHRALAGLAKLASAEGDLGDAIKLYKQAINVIPLPSYAAALGDVYAKAGRPAEAKQQYDLVEYINRLNVFNQAVYNRELSVFYADHDIHLRQALELARKEFEIRHDIYTWDALAWALYKNSQPGQAAVAIKEALRLGTKDPLLFFHAGMIYERLGDSQRAGDYLARAIALNPQFHLFYADIARTTLQGLPSGSLTVAGHRIIDARP